MTSENQPGRRPPTIDLTATEVENPAAGTNSTMDAAKDAAAESAPKDSKAGPDQTAAPPSQSGRSRIYALSGLIGIIALAAIAGALWYNGFIPGHENSPSVAAAPSAAPDAANGDLAARLDKIERALQTPPQQSPAQMPPALANRLGAAEAQNKSLAESITALKQRVDDVAAASQNAAKQASAAAAAANAAQSGLKDSVQDTVKEAVHSADQSGALRSDLATLNDRVASLENAVKALSEKETHADASAPANDQALRLALAASALRGEVERGAPYRSELDAAKALGADQESLAALDPFAATGVPSAHALARELAALAPELRRNAVTTSDTTFLGKLEANAEKLVRFTPINAPAGNDPAAVTARVAIDAAHDDIAAALTDIAALPDKAKPLAADWAKKAQAREAAIAASRRIAADAMAAITKPAAQ
jgi:hypothetical protein